MPIKYYKGHVIDSDLLGNPGNSNKYIEIEIVLSCSCPDKLGKQLNPNHSNHRITRRRTCANTYEWAVDIGMELVDALLGDGRFSLVVPACTHQDVMLQCQVCGEWKPVFSGFYADLQGEPFKAYHCLACRLDEVNAKSILGL